LIVELPEWQPFAPGDTPWTPDASGAGRVVLLFAPAAARRDAWASRLALDLVGAWGDAGQKVVLADGVLEYPTMHRELGLSNTEGVADAALFGASVSRVARPVPGRAFFFVSAGSPTGNPEAVATSPRWGRLLEGFRDAGVTLVLFLRSGCAAEESLAAEADDIVVLAGSAEDLPEGARRMADRVRFVMGPEAGSATTAQPVAVDPSAAERRRVEWGEVRTAPDPFESIPSQESLSADMASGVVHPGDSGAPTEDATVTAPAEARGYHDEPLRFDAPEQRLEYAAATTGDALDDLPRDDEAQPEPLTVAYTPTRSRRRTGGADPDARKKLLWVGLVVLVLVVLVIVGALRSG
jgi:hypothetical protein